MPSERPTHGQILTWLRELLDEDGDLDRDAAAEEDLYFQKFDVLAPEGHRVVRLGSAPADVDQGIESIQPADEIAVHVEPAKDTQDWKDRADNRSKWLQALMRLWRLPDDRLQQLLWAEFVQRRRWVQLCYSPLPPNLTTPPNPYDTETWESYSERLEQWENQRDAWLPVIPEIKPRGTVLARIVGGKIIYLFEHYLRTVADLTYWYPPERFPAVKRYTRGMSPNQVVTFTSFWHDDWRAAYVDDVPIFPSTPGSSRGSQGVIANEYRFVPFVEFYFRKLPIEFDSSRQYRGFLSNSKEAYEIESQLATQYLTIITREAWPTILTRLLDNRTFRQIPGETFPLRPGEAVEAFNGAGPLPEVGQAWERIRGSIRQNALGTGAGGVPAGVRSAEALSMVSSVDRNKVMPALRRLKTGSQELLIMSLKVIENLHRQPVTLPLSRDQKGKGRALRQITLDPNDIRGYYDVDVEFGPKFGAEVFQRASQLGGLVQQEFLARERAWKLLPELFPSIEDAEQELIQQKSDSHPLMVMAHVMRRLATFDPPMFQYMVKVGAFSPNQSANGAGGGAQGGNTAPGAGTGTPAAMQPPSPGGQPAGPPGGVQGAQIGQASAGQSPPRAALAAGRR